MLTGLAEGVLDGDLTTGAGSATAASLMGFLWGFSVSFASFTGPFPGLPSGFSIISIFLSGPFLLISLDLLVAFSQYLS